MSHDRDRHIIQEGLDWYLARGVWYDGDANAPPSLMPDLSTWTATYTVWPSEGANEPAVIGPGAAVTATITLGLAGDQQAATTLASGAAEGASTVTLTSATGVSDGDQVAIWLDTDMIFVTTVNGAPAGAVVTLTQPLPDPAASGKAVKAYSPEFALHNVLLYIGRADTSSLEPWGQGTYNLDLIDPFGHVSVRFSDDCIFEEGQDHV